MTEYKSYLQMLPKDINNILTSYLKKDPEGLPVYLIRKWQPFGNGIRPSRWQHTIIYTTEFKQILNEALEYYTEDDCAAICKLLDCQVSTSFKESVLQELNKFSLQEAVQICNKVQRSFERPKRIIIEEHIVKTV
jgi:hypothetical protein